MWRAGGKSSTGKPTDAEQGAGGEMTTRVKDWNKFQHFKDRRPPWVKLYRDILDDLEWHDLDPEAAKTLVMLWLIASEYDGELPDIRTLAFRLRKAEDEVNSLISKLSHWLEQDDNAAISERYQDDRLEGERETETEGDKKSPTPRKGRKTKAPELTFADWTAALGDEPAFATDDPIFEWAASTGIPREWIAVAWWIFESRYSENAKTYADWRQVFRKAVREDWLKAWRHDAREGAFVLTTAGIQAQREMK